MDTLPPNYPSWWETHVVLADGAPVELRPIKPSDRDLIAAFHKRQSTQSIYFRFFRYRPELSDKELDFFTQVDYVDRMAFVALLGDEVVAVARYEQVPSLERPEVAFFVDDEHHGRGLATLMLEYLAAAARSQGMTGFTATVLPENYAMLGVFRKAGFGVKTRFDDGVIEVELDIALTAAGTKTIADRESRARSQSVARLLQPKGVAVVGASRRAGHIGHELLRHLRDGGFTGGLHAVNSALAPGPGGGEESERILGVPTWRSLSAIDTPVDLAIVAVPAEAVEDVVAEAAVVGVCGLLVVSAGYSELGPDGIDRERRLVSLARRNGMRLIGPNAFGLVNTDPEVSLEALFLPIEVESGAAALMAQSGPLGSAVLNRMRHTGVGISSFVAVGNRADVSVNDLVEYWATDDATEAILLYVENYGNLRTFARLASAVSVRKPIVTVRPPDLHLTELLAQSGVILVDGVAELADVALMATRQPLPRGDRVAVVANAASVGRLAVAACRRQGLQVVRPVSMGEPDPASPNASEAVLIGDVDTIAFQAPSEMNDVEQIVVAAAIDENVDSLLVAVVPSLDLSLDDLAELLDRIDRSIDKPIVAAGLVDGDLIDVDGLPLFSFPEEAAQALGRITAHARWRREAPAPEAEVGETDGGDGKHRDESDDADPVVGAAASREGLVELLGDHDEVRFNLWTPEAARLVELLEVPVADWRVAERSGDIEAAAEELGYPVVLKASGIDARTVGEAGGTAIDLHDDAQLRAAYERMSATLGPALVPAVVQKMVSAAGNAKIELIQDPNLGVFVQVGVGGSVGLTLGARCRRYLPLTDTDIALLVEALAEAAVVDDEAREIVQTLLRRLGQLGAEVPELSHLCLDPVLVAGAATAVADLRVTLRPWRSDPLAEVRKL